MLYAYKGNLLKREIFILNLTLLEQLVICRNSREGELGDGDITILKRSLDK